MGADILELIVSLVVLLVGGDQFVIGIARLAASFRVRLVVVGVIVGGIGTSLPELIVAFVASARGDVPLAMGNLVGSVIANLALGLAIAALVAPVRVDSRTVRREAPLSVACVLLFGVLAAGGLSRVEGVVLAIVLVAALALLVVNARTGKARDKLAGEVGDFFDARRPHPTRNEVVRALVGLAGMVGGADLLVRSGSSLAARWGLAQGFVGLTIVAIGTSAPLIASSVQASRRGDHDLVAGNVLGGNLIIALAGGAIVAFVAATPAGRIGAASLWLMGAITLAAWGFMARRSAITRWEAATLVLAYSAMLPFLNR
jgi:cation:H+ antiporter